MRDIDLAALKADYNRDGFVILRGFLDAAEVAELRDHAIPLAAKLLARAGDQGKFRNLMKSLHRHDDWFKAKLENGKHVPLIEHCLGGDVVGASAAWFDRPEGETQGIEPHVDLYGPGNLPDAGATIWIALDPVDRGNGCLHYLRGSHRNSYPSEIPIPGIDTESDDAVAVELLPGDASIHNALTVHWSGGNSTGAPRRAVSYFYFGARAHAALQKRKMGYSS